MSHFKGQLFKVRTNNTTRRIRLSIYTVILVGGSHR